MPIQTLAAALPGLSSVLGGGGGSSSESSATSSLNVAISPNISANTGGTTRQGSGATASGSPGSSNPFTAPPQNQPARYDIDQAPAAAVKAGLGGGDGNTTLILLGIAGIAVLVMLGGKGKR